MPADPTDPDTFGPGEQDTDRDGETPEADAAEQRAEIRRRDDDALTHIDSEAVSEGDAVEQARAVDLDEDEDGYR
jgi:hypothetical protein